MKPRNRVPIKASTQVSTSSSPELGENGDLSNDRIRDAEQAVRIYDRFKKDDEEAAWKRANIDLLIDGDLPYDPAVLRDAGQGDRTNVNFKEAKAEEDAAMTPYIEMTTQTDILWRLYSTYGDARQQLKNNQILSEEHTRAHRQWGQDFEYYRLRLTQQFNRHGVGFLYWENEHDWRWRADGLNAFKVDRNTEARPSAMGTTACERSIPVDELYRFIRNERRAKEVGRWNVEAVKYAITSCSGRQKTTWSDFVREAKENDSTVGKTYQQVQVVHLWQPEFDGTISHYIVLQKGAATDEAGRMIGNGFLYQHRRRFNRLSECIIPFFYGVGTHGTIHSIRGQGELNFGPITIGNRLRCKELDALQASISILLEVESPNDMEQVGITHIGPYLCVRGGKINPTALPDVSARVLPALRDMQMLRQNLTGSFQARAVTEQGTQERTKYEVQAQQQQGHRLDSAAMTQYFGPWSLAGGETLRRMLNPKLREDDPGGKEAFEFRRRCMKRGVPAEALDWDLIDRVEAVRTIGNGSPEMRQYAAEKVWSYKGDMDRTGRREAFKMVLTSVPGMNHQNAELLIGPEEERTDANDEMAELENNDFRQGLPVPVMSHQAHWIHCQHHIALVTETVQAFEQQQIGAELLVPILSTALGNMLEHAEYLNRDPSRVQEAAYVRKFCQQNNGTLQQQEQKLIAEQRRQQQEVAQQPGMSPEDQRKWEAHQLDMQIRQQDFAMRNREFEQKLAQQDAEARQSRALRDAEAAVRIAERTTKLNGVAV